MKSVNLKANSPLQRLLASFFLLSCAALLAGCFPKPPADDEGHASFAREAIPVVLGRRPHGVDEVEVVADVAQLLGRNVAVKMLMKDKDYIEHWADVIVDLLEMQRQGQGGLGVAQDDTCWGAPTRANPDPAIAEWVRDHGPKDSGAPTPWNMTDLLYSAILIDDLSPIHRANLFTTSIRRAGGNGGNTEQTNYLLRVYLNRDLGCLGCHNPENSTSNKVDPGTGDILWRRLWNIPGHPEKALFGNYLDGNGAFASITPIMRGDVRRPENSGFGIRPWGMSEECANDTDIDSPANNGVLTHEGFQNIPSGASDNPSAYFGSVKGQLNGKVSLWELEQALHGGIFNLQDGYERFPATSVNHPPGSDEEKYCGFVEALPNCTSCHNSTQMSGGMDLSGNDPGGVVVNTNTTSPASVNTKRVVPNNLGASEVRLNITEGMGTLTQPQIDDVENWISSGAPDPGDAAICNTSSIPDVHPDEAFAFLTAANLVDGIWKSVMGYKLTIDHGFPRSSQQLHMLWNLTEYEFLPKGWSLKAVLAKILRSSWFARRAPNLSQEGTAYELPAILDPWIVADPTLVSNPKPHERNNGQGELVDMYRVNTLLRNISDALGWKEPRRFPGGGYPSPLDQELGQFLSPGLPGFDGVNFQSLLALESGLGAAASCAKAGRSVDNNDDWIDALKTAIDNHNTDNPEGPVTLGEAWSMLKDRLIQDTTIETTLPSGLASLSNAQTEEQALVAFFREGTDNTLTVNSPTSALSDTALEQKLRAGCNVLIKSPEFMLPNVTPRGYSDNNMPDPPRLAACMPGEKCGYPQICGSWRGVLKKMGHQTICEDRTIREGWWLTVGIWEGLDLVVKPVKFTNFRPHRAPTFSPIPPRDRPGMMMLFNPDTINTSNRPPIDRKVFNQGAPDSISADAGQVTASTMLSSESESISAKQDATGPVIGGDVALRPEPKIKLDILRDVKVVDAASGKNITLAGPDRIRQRLDTLCLAGMCGFVARSNIKQCLMGKPETGVCNSLRTMCDPRCEDGENCCGDAAADIDEPGVLSIWAEGSVVRGADRVRILGLNDRRWRPLEKDTKLNAGDLLDIPLEASIAIHSGNVLFGDTAVDPHMSAVKGHVVAITGPSAIRLLNQPTKKNALSPNAVAAGTRSGKYLSRGFDRKDYLRIINAQVLPANKYVPTHEEIWKMNQDFDSLHFPKESGLAPDGSAFTKQ